MTISKKYLMFVLAGIVAIALVGMLVLAELGEDNEEIAVNAPAKDFSFHSGVKFGMSMDEVISIEEDSGFTAEIAEKNPNAVSIKCSIASFDESFLTYVFEDGILNKVCYYFRDSNSEDEIFNIVKSKLNIKYGNPLAEGAEYLDFEVGSTVVDTFNEMNAVLPCELNDFAQWCFPIEEGYVNLTLIDFECIGVRRVDATYIYMTEEYYNGFLSKIEDELADKNNALDNDL